MREGATKDRGLWVRICDENGTFSENDCDPVPEGAEVLNVRFAFGKEPDESPEPGAGT